MVSVAVSSLPFFHPAVSVLRDLDLFRVCAFDALVAMVTNQVSVFPIDFLRNDYPFRFKSLFHFVWYYLLEFKILASRLAPLGLGYCLLDCIKQNPVRKPNHNVVNCLPLLDFVASHFYKRIMA